jgi:hypothetical protein
MSKPQSIEASAEPAEGKLFHAAVGLAIVLCLASCTLFLLVPTQSISVDTVYEGF